MLIYEGRGQKHRGSAANFLSNDRYCHLVDGIFVTNYCSISGAICPNFLQKWLGDKEIKRDRERISITSSFAQRRTPGLGCCHKI
jgi:hypothetical protein